MTQTPDTSAEAVFAEWFRKNYPGPDTIIHKPDWHAPKIYRAATRALAAERDALQAELAEARELPWRASDIRRGLILFRTSSNAHGYTNYSALSGKIDALPDAAKEELAAIMTNMALGFSRDDVLRNGVVQQWLAEARNKALDDALAVKIPSAAWGFNSLPQEWDEAIRALKEDTQ